MGQCPSEIVAHHLQQVKSDLLLPSGLHSLNRQNYTIMEASDVFLQFRARLASTQHLVSLLSVIGDRRVKRVIELLNEISYHGEVIPPCFREILRICSDDPLRYRGFHLRLNHLDEQVSKATDVLVESSKRIILYLDHIKANDSKLPVSTRLLTHSAVHEQMELARSLRQKAHLATSAALAKPPGPAPMPYDNPRDEAITKPNLERKLVEGKPYPIGKDYDARWDPDFKMPGSQHGKFFKFPGPFFSPDTTHAIFDHFLLSETVADLLENFNRKFSDCLANFKNTNRFQAEEDVAMLEGLGEVNCSITFPCNIG